MESSATVELPEKPADDPEETYMRSGLIIAHILKEVVSEIEKSGVGDKISVDFA